MTMFVRLRLAELLEERGLTQAELRRSTRLSEDRVSRLFHNRWSQITRKEIGLLLQALDATPAELFKVYARSVFFGSRWVGPLAIHVSARYPRGSAEPAIGGAQDLSGDPLTFNDRDIQAYKAIYDHARSLGIEVALEPHGRDSLTPAGYLDLVRDGTHVIIGSNLTGQLSEFALAQMYDAPAFDDRVLDQFPFNFSWTQGRNVRSSFGFEGGPRQVDEGIYSTREKRVVAWRTHVPSGVGKDCGLIAVYRVESPPDQDVHGIRKERCVIVVAGHGRLGTLGCAQVLVDPRYEEQLYPETAKQPRMFVVQVEYFRPQPSTQPTTRDVSTFQSADIVAEA